MTISIQVRPVTYHVIVNQNAKFFNSNSNSTTNFFRGHSQITLSLEGGGGLQKITIEGGWPRITLSKLSTFRMIF